MRLDPLRALATLVLGLLVFLELSSGCQARHVCSPCCERSGYQAGSRAAPDATAEESPAPAAAQEPDAPVKRSAQALTSAQALEAFEKAWKAIYDTHFDPQFNGVDWIALHDELRPRAEAARTREEVREVIADMLERLRQSHFVVIPAEVLPDRGGAEGGTLDESAGLGFDVRLRGGKLLVSAVEAGSSAAAAGVKTGWSAKRIGDLDVEEALAKLRTASEVLQERHIALQMWAAARGRILGERGGKVKVLFLDGNEREVELELERTQRDVVAHSFGTTLPTFYLEFHSEVLERDGRKIGVIRFSNWFLPMMAKIDEAVERMRGLDGIVLDLRGNTGGAGAMCMGVAGHFFEETRDLGVMRTRDSTINILALPRTVSPAGEIVQPFGGPVAILTDETTGSASEVFAGGMQSVARARVFGETSAGAVLPAMTTPLPDGDALLHALGDFVTATGVHLEGQGVIPDEPVVLERADLLAGRDSQLEAALAWIVSRKRS